MRTWPMLRAVSFVCLLIFGAMGPRTVAADDEWCAGGWTTLPWCYEMSSPWHGFCNSQESSGCPFECFNPQEYECQPQGWYTACECVFAG